MNPSGILQFNGKSLADNSGLRDSVTGARGYPAIPVMNWEDCTKDTSQGERILIANPTFNSQIIVKLQFQKLWGSFNFILTGENLL